jgi:uncharacterized protein (DUF433 family)
MIATAGSVLTSNGIYTRSQAAYLARLRPQTVSKWFTDTPRLGPAVHREHTENGDRVVSFVDLVQLMAVRAIRNTRVISLQKIREAAARADEMGITFPFARNGIKVFLLGDEVVFKVQNGDMIEATGKTAKHYMIEPVIYPYLEGVDFDPDGVASQYRPPVVTGVVLDPKRQWGAPVLEESNYTVSTLVSSVLTEGSIEAAADMCGVSESDVRMALRFDDFLRGAA